MNSVKNNYNNFFDSLTHDFPLFQIKFIYNLGIDKSLYISAYLKFRDRPINETIKALMG